MEKFRGKEDMFYTQAIHHVITTQKATISGVQRKLKTGFHRSNEMIIAMQEQGIVSDHQSDGTRTVLYPIERASEFCI